MTGRRWINTRWAAALIFWCTMRHSFCRAPDKLRNKMILLSFPRMRNNNPFDSFFCFSFIEKQFEKEFEKGRNSFFLLFSHIFSHNRTRIILRNEYFIEYNTKRGENDTRIYRDWEESIREILDDSHRKGATPSVLYVYELVSKLV